MKYIDAEKLKAEIERRKAPFKKDIEDGVYPTYLCALMDFEEFITSLQQEQPEEPDKNLEEAARHSEILTYPMPDDGDIEKVMKVQEARIFHEIGFITGAEWQKEQIQTLSGYVV